MKAGTDGVLLGAWSHVPATASSAIWDVGCGTGLIALMMAQRSPAHITGIEIDDNAADEAAENAKNSLWHNRINVVKGDINIIAPQLPSPDLIISNPPFFTASLLPCDRQRTQARHEGTLTYESLIKTAYAHLSAHGVLSLIAPADKLPEIEEYAYMNHLPLCRLAMVYSKHGKKPLRVMAELSRQNTTIALENIEIRDSDNNYTLPYIDLTKDFYLDSTWQPQTKTP